MAHFPAWHSCAQTGCVCARSRQQTWQRGALTPGTAQGLDINRISASPAGRSLLFGCAGDLGTLVLDMVDVRLCICTCVTRRPLQLTRAIRRKRPRT